MWIEWLCLRCQSNSQSAYTQRTACDDVPTILIDLQGDLFCSVFAVYRQRKAYIFVLLLADGMYLTIFFDLASVFFAKEAIYEHDSQATCM